MGYAEGDLYPINPVTWAKYRNAFRPSGAKDDPADAALALDRLERQRDVLKGWHPDTEATRLLRSLCEDRRKAVDARTALCNSMRTRLKESYPQALHWVGEQLSGELCGAFLMKGPRFDLVAAASSDTVRRFSYAQHSRSQTQIQERLERIAKSRPLTTDPAVVESAMRWVKMLVAQIRAFNRSIHADDERMAEVFKTHSDRAIFASFPGAGKPLGPRLVAVFGTDRSRYAEAVNIATDSGVAPVIERSGQQEWIRWRWHCPKFLRQSLVEFAGISVMYSTWARLYYQDQIRKGKKYPAAVRTLAFKWLRILFRCWKERTTDDEAKYLASLQRHGSWIATAIKNEA